MTPIPTGSAIGPPRVGPARLWRLSLKELRETLRDRRTVITLVLMPLLVYPVLSLAFRQFLLASFQDSAELQYRIAVPSQPEGLIISMLLNQGDSLLKERESAAATAPLSGGPTLGAELGAKEPAVSSIDWRLATDIETAVREQDVDLGIRLLPAEEGGPIPDASRPGETRFQLVYRPNTPISRQVVSFVERRLRAVNESNLRERLAAKGDEGPQRTAWRLKPVADEKGQSFWLGALVPLILILMTITGSVYPAIDLTAGERERGTLESLMATPVPRAALLTAKYIAVVTVAMLTAVVNLTAMVVTIASSGLGPRLFGNNGDLSMGDIAAVFMLLALFAAFFAAVVLCITSFARSFKEAQAYLVPLMLVSLAPGYMSVMPGLELGPLLSVTPLANIVLLARDVLEGDAPILWGAVAVLSTALYGGMALALAARIFGSDAILYGSEGSWSEFFRPPRERKSKAAPSDALTALAVVAPLYVIANGFYVQLRDVAMPAQLMAACGITLLLFVALPLLAARWQGVETRPGFQLFAPSPLSLLGAALLGGSLGWLVYECLVFSQQIGLSTFSSEQLEAFRTAADAMVAKWRSVPFAAVVTTFAIAPAVCEELFFRGYLLNSFRGKMSSGLAIALTSVVFGLFHAAVGGIISIEHILGSTLLGLALGWVCWISHSVIPGMLLHALSNGIMLAIAYFSSDLKAWGWDAEHQRYLPTWLLSAATLAACAGFFLVWLGRARAATAPPDAIHLAPGRAI